MTVRELGHECGNYDCAECPYDNECNKLQKALQRVSPEWLLALIELDLDCIGE